MEIIFFFLSLSPFLAFSLGLDTFLNLTIPFSLWVTVLPTPSTPNRILPLGEKCGWRRS